MGDDRAAAYWEDGVAVFRASALATCPKALAALLMDYEPVDTPGFLKDAFEFGNEHEHLAIEKWLADHPEYSLVNTQEEINFKVGELDGTEIVVRGHGDGVVQKTDPGSRAFLEVKWLGRDYLNDFLQNRLYDKIPSYPLQIAAYMKGYGQAFNMDAMPCFYIVADKETYKNSGEVVLYEEYLTEPPAELSTVTPKLYVAVNHAKKGEFPNELCNKQGLCPVPYLHDDVDDPWTAGVDEAVELDGDDASQIDEVAAEYVKARDEEKAAKKRKSDMGKKMRQLLELHGDRVSTGKFRVTRVVQHKNRLNKTRMQEDGIDLSKYEEPYSYDYPLIKGGDGE